MIDNNENNIRIYDSLVYLVSLLRDGNEAIIIKTKNGFDIGENLVINMKIYEYPIMLPNIKDLNNYDILNTNIQCTYYNFCINRTSKRYAVFWSKNYLPLVENIKRMIDRLNIKERSDDILVHISGKVLYKDDKYFYVDTNSATGSRLISNRAKFVTLGKINGLNKRHLTQRYINDSKHYIYLGNLFIHNKDCKEKDIHSDDKDEMIKLTRFNSCIDLILNCNKINDKEKYNIDYLTNNYKIHKVYK